MKNQFDAVIFDLGGVLIDWNPRYLYRKLIADETLREHFLTEICSPAWNLQQDAGRPWREAVAELSAKFPQHKSLINAYYTRWEEMLGGEIGESVTILKALKQQAVKLYALTNWSTETFPIAERHYPFLQWFKGILVSGHEKLIKPDAAIFHLLFKRYQIDPSKAVFIDDSDINVRGARNVGLTAIKYESSDALRTALISLKLLVE